jgi:hypothetical protein
MINGKYKAVCASYASNQKQIIFFAVLYKDIYSYLLRVPILLMQLIMSSGNPPSSHFSLLDSNSTEPQLKTIPARVTRHYDLSKNDTLYLNEQELIWK